MENAVFFSVRYINLDLIKGGKMQKNFKLEHSLTHPDKAEIWLLNKKGFYNFQDYINLQDVEKFSKEHKKDVVINKLKSPFGSPPASNKLEVL